MSTTGTAIINKVATVLYDVTNVKWSRAELLGWLNDAQRAMVNLMPEASYAVKAVQLAPGTRQYIPNDGWVLLTVTSNLGTNGATRGRALKKVLRTDLDETAPNWYDAPAQSAPTVFMYDDRDRTAYDVSPPSDGTGWVEVIYALLPVDLATEASTIVVLDIYQPAIVDYMLFRAKSKSAPFAGDSQQAEAYYGSFMDFMKAAGADITKSATSTE